MLLSGSRYVLPDIPKILTTEVQADGTCNLRRDIVDGSHGALTEVSNVTVLMSLAWARVEGIEYDKIRYRV
jgi:hypothetical protein